MVTKLLFLVVCCITLALGADGVPSSDELSDEERCSQPMDEGKGYSSSPRYFFNGERGECELFFFYGSGGNENKFKSRQECNEVCKISKDFQDITKDICLLPKFVGRGKAALPRFYFNSKKKKCQRFTFGGGVGNPNNFQTKEECEKMCSNRHENVAEHAVDTNKNPGQKKAICLLPKMVGRGRSAFRRFFFNVMTDKCEKFIFGGGLGNENNFKSKVECEEMCINAEKDPQFSPPTSLPTSQPTRQPLSTQTVAQQQYTQKPSNQSPGSQSPSGQAQTSQSPSMPAPSKDKKKIEQL